MEGRPCPAAGTEARQRCEACRAIASEMNSTPELCHMSAGSDSLVSDNQTCQREEGEALKSCVCVCVDSHNVGL